MSNLELRYAHMAKRDTPARKANREALQKLIEEIQSEPGNFHTATGPSLHLAPRYAKGKIRKSL